MKRILVPGLALVMALAGSVMEAAERLDRRIQEAIGVSPLGVDVQLGEIPVPAARLSLTEGQGQAAAAAPPAGAAFAAGAFERLFAPEARRNGNDRFLLAADSIEPVKTVAANLAAETGMNVVVERLGDGASEELFQAAPLTSRGGLSSIFSLPKAEPFQWIGTSMHFEGGTQIADGGVGVTLVNNLVRVAGDLAIVGGGWSVTVSPLSPILRNLRVQPTVTRKYFVRENLDDSKVDNVTVRAPLLYGVTVRPFSTGKVSVYAQAGNAEVTTGRWLDTYTEGKGRDHAEATEKMKIFIVGTSIRF